MAEQWDWGKFETKATDYFVEGFDPSNLPTHFTLHSAFFTYFDLLSPLTDKKKIEQTRFDIYAGKYGIQPENSFVLVMNPNGRLTITGDFVGYSFASQDTMGYARETLRHEIGDVHNHPILPYNPYLPEGEVKKEYLPSSLDCVRLLTSEHILKIIVSAENVAVLLRTRATTFAPDSSSASSLLTIMGRTKGELSYQRKQGQLRNLAEKYQRVTQNIKPGPQKYNLLGKFHREIQAMKTNLMWAVDEESLDELGIPLYLGDRDSLTLERVV